MGSGEATLIDPGSVEVVREGPDFVFWFMKIGLVFVAACVAVSVTLFLVFKRYSQKEARRLDEIRNRQSDGR